jgi:hypothetical protein
MIEWNDLRTKDRCRGDEISSGLFLHDVFLRVINNKQEVMVFKVS